MKKIYNISLGQLITIWVFGVCATFYFLSLLDYDSDSSSGFFAILLPFLLVFYTIGWRNLRKKNIKNSIETPKPRNMVEVLGNKAIQRKDETNREKQEEIKKRNIKYDMIFFTIIFFFAFGQTANSDSNNIGIEIFAYLLYTIAAIVVLIKARKRDKQLLREAKEDDVASLGKHKSFRNSVLAIVVLTLLLVVSFVVSKDNSSESPNVNAIFQDAIYNTNQSGNNNYTNFVKDMFRVYQQEGANRFASVNSLDKSNLLELSSYETVESLNERINLLRDAILEVENSEQSLIAMKEEAKKTIQYASISESEKIEVLKGFNSSVDDSEQSRLRRLRFEALKVFYQDTLKLYVFLKQNFSDYEIGFDENSEEKIFFSHDANRNKYISLASEVDTSVLRFTKADEAYKKYANERLKSLGIDVTADEIQNAIYN